MASGGAARFGKGLLGRVRQRTTVVLLVDAPDAIPEVLAAGLQEGLGRLAAVVAPSRGPDELRVKYVAPPIATSGGQVVLIDFGDLSAKWRVVAVHELAQGLTDAGVQGAVIGVPDTVHEAWQEMVERGPVARSHVSGPLPRPYGDADDQGALRLARGLLPLARSLAGENLPLYGVVATAATPLEWSIAERFVDDVLTAGSPEVILAASDGRSRLVSLPVEVPPSPTAAVTSLGGDVIADMNAMRASLTELAPLMEWAAVTASADAENVWWSGTSWDYLDRAGDVSRSPGVGELGYLMHLFVPDAAWYQVLGPGHIARLGGPPAGAIRLTENRWELTIGRPEQWLPHTAGRQEIVSRGRELLVPLLADRSEAAVAKNAQRERARARYPGYFNRERR